MSKILANLTTRQRITILVVAIAVGAGLYSMVQWKKEGDFRPLFTGVSPEDAASIVQKLKESGAEYRLPEGGGSIDSNGAGAASGARARPRCGHRRPGCLRDRAP